MLSILNNPAASAAQRVLAVSQHAIGRAVERLGSGLRINSARDDAAGVAISVRLQARGRQAGVDLRSMNDMVSLLQVADSSLGSTTADLQRIRELAVQAASSTLTSSDREALQREAGTLIEAARQRQARTRFNGQALLDGSLQVQGFVGQSDAAIALHVAPLFLARTTDVLFRLAQLAQARTSVSPVAALGSGQLVINGRSVGATLAGAQPGQGADSAWALAEAIRGAGIAGLVVESAGARVEGTPVVPPAGGLVTAGAIVVNGVPTGAGAIVNAINAISGQTGVSASAITGTAPPGFPANVPITLVLQAIDGRSIDISGAGAFGVADQHAAGSVSLTGPLAERPAAELQIAGSSPANAGLAAGQVAATDSGEPVVVPLDEASGYDQNPDLTNSAGAAATIALMDRKLDKLLGLRTGLGAALNALDQRQAYLAQAQEAGSAALARILDADYAVEMAEFTHASIIRSAALALLAQANLQPAQMLSLLLPAAANPGSTRAV